jgi:hypothetical protein
MNLEAGQLVKFSYMDEKDAMLGIVTKSGADEVRVLWSVGGHTHKVSYKDFQHALDNGVYELVE